jgi:LCP family protein required for cell wall assembly
VSRVATIVVAAALLLSTVLAGGLWAAQRYLAAPVNPGEVTTFLLLGGDDGPFRGGSVLESDADAIHLLVLSPDQQHATLVNIPRDSWVSIPGHGTDKLSQCLKLGPEGCVETLETLWDIEIDHFLLTEFNGLKTAVNRFGGIPIDVPHSVRDGGEPVSAGHHRLNGAQALAFVRDRTNRPGHDFARSEAQSDLLRAAHRTMLEERGTVGAATELVGLVQQTTVSDLRTDELLRYAYQALRLPPEHVESVRLPASVGYAGALSVVHLDPSAVEVVRDVVADGRHGATDG